MGVPVTRLHHGPLLSTDSSVWVMTIGAELNPEDVEMLTRCLPKPDGEDFDWPEFLTRYSQPVKRIELEENRRERLQRWPEEWLSKEDRKLMQKRPQAVPGAVAGEAIGAEDHLT